MTDDQYAELLLLLRDLAEAVKALNETVQHLPRKVQNAIEEATDNTY